MAAQPGGSGAQHVAVERLGVRGEREHVGAGLVGHPWQVTARGSIWTGGGGERLV
ncbi:hypothetical protein [Ornithinimicrobium kibberense]|uniref:hypothetical protein n=1 Tax=Ornithinimicrobium kibberense TaxID=282060 RepID=UPI003612B25D